ncbi:hypothetical protein [Mucilaginibacter psychrotolerans]|uniref:Uncharacterized protein n=1 Tax=Mucilaginibacter psychrotolerans TaxID=1524096 RepID=A0A4Y8SNT9_9SPHI|nr:hypothetical protein [Mucilaginibacter psychrotolerans]TFF40207.1 hypothetical protein E2R66_02860 [Mucilaginibacter psychrotolerans]
MLKSVYFLLKLMALILAIVQYLKMKPTVHAYWLPYVLLIAIYVCYDERVGRHQSLQFVRK